MFTLFVPDRASSAFPCFDQPDLKARFQLALDVPASWIAVSNGAETGSFEEEGRRVVRFGETEPLSSYQFAFAAGHFQVIERTVGGRTMRAFHREADPKKLHRNLDAVMDLHSGSLEWLELFTGVAYPYGKFDFVLIPSFQFGGMEHPGAVFYRDSGLLLEAAATPTEELNRASLIAHETAHMWFGDLVTMRWFEEAGRPWIEAQLEVDQGQIHLSQEDPEGRNRVWMQSLSPCVLDGNARRCYSALLRGRRLVIDPEEPPAASALLLPNSSPSGYGFFRLPEVSAFRLLEQIHRLEEPSWRALVWLSLWEEVLEGTLHPQTFFDGLLTRIPEEPDDLLREYLLQRAGEAFWLYGFIDDGDRAIRLERLLWEGVRRVEPKGARSAFLKTLASTATTDEGIDLLRQAWAGSDQVAGLDLGEEELSRMALELALRLEGTASDSVLDLQERRILSEERRDEFRFVRRALSSGPGQRDRFFRSILESVGEDRETWVLEAARLLAQPLRGEESMLRVAEGLSVLQTIERRGSIFYPQRWLNALLWGKSSAALNEVVLSFLDDTDDLPGRLRLKVLQAADKSFRTSRSRR